VSRRRSAASVEAPVEIGAAELVGDEEGLARRVGGGIGQARLEDVEGSGEVGRQQPLPVRGVEGGAELGGPVTADLEQRLGDGPADR
jgi:hypothetical protein